MEFEQADFYVCFYLFCRFEFPQGQGPLRGPGVVCFEFGYFFQLDGQSVREMMVFWERRWDFDTIQGYAQAHVPVVFSQNSWIFLQCEL